MRKIDRFKLIDTIGRELQSQMSYTDIDIYLNGFGIDVSSKKTSGANSKWVYTKEILSDEPDNVVISIADELELEHSYKGSKNIDLSDSKFWSPNYFRLFFTHLSSFKSQTSILQNTLRKYGISGFVAHTDIEPTKEWLVEIEKALFSMDALAAILMPGFHESNWTDHEVGVAVGRDILVIPIRRGLDPYGFIGKYQGLQAKDRTVNQVASAIFEIVLSHSKTSTRMLECLVSLFLMAGNIDDAKHFLELLGNSSTFPESHGEKLRESFSSNEVISKNDYIRNATNDLLKKHGMEPVPDLSRKAFVDDEVPF